MEGGVGDGVKVENGVTPEEDADKTPPLSLHPNHLVEGADENQENGHTIDNGHTSGHTMDSGGAPVPRILRRTRANTRLASRKSGRLVAGTSSGCVENGRYLSTRSQNRSSADISKVWRPLAPLTLHCGV